MSNVAPLLNASCHCIWLDRRQLQTQLEVSLGTAGQQLADQPGLVAGNVVFIDPHEAAAMDRTQSLVHRALTSETFRAHVRQHARSIARLERPDSGLLGIDFHLGGSLPQLIEINTNPGGLLINFELARALTACCREISSPLPQLAAGNIPLSTLPRHVLESFRSAWSSVRGDRPLDSIAIVDDEPGAQYLYPEFLLYRRLFESAGWRAVIADPARFEIGDGQLSLDGERIDLVYNRLTDFYFNEQRHAALRHAHESGAAVITPHPAAHAHWADKRLLAWLRDESLLAAAGLDEAERLHLLQSIPPTEIVRREAADDLWRRRKALYFKPVDGYGSKATYSGAKLTRTVFEQILERPYVAQAVAPTSMRRVIVEDQETDLRVDVRNYCSDGTTMLRAARLYRGQTTNFRTPGGGFAPVLTLR